MIPLPAYSPKVNQSKGFAYLLQSEKNGTFYLGWTSDVIRRVEEHNFGESTYTKTRGPWKLVGVEEFQDHESAKKRERTLKHNPKMLFLFKKRMISQLSAGRQVVG
ncbi:MAG: hypothetical protein A2901_08960 [Elusimicrobia bacterium RIFCSPLOWO2_01_FULL_54_10]|nr:MAG: hypothetical protein A2901_08960 [Elusimicrobia bacterium RIFCSPLOWO2_01_FULL_54_10]